MSLSPMWCDDLGVARLFRDIHWGTGFYVIVLVSTKGWNKLISNVFKRTAPAQ